MRMMATLAVDHPDIEDFVDAKRTPGRLAMFNLSVLASDAFFPATDNIETAAKAGIKVIVQPGGSIKDEDVIAACNKHKMVMMFTGQRCFKH